VREEDGRQAEGKTKRLQFFPLSSLLPSFTLAAASAQGRPSSSSPLFSSSSFSSALLERGGGARRGIAGLRGAQRRRRGRFFRRIEGTRAEAKKMKERGREAWAALSVFLVLQEQERTAPSFLSASSLFFLGRLSRTAHSSRVPGARQRDIERGEEIGTTNQGQQKNKFIVSLPSESHLVSENDGHRFRRVVRHGAREGTYSLLHFRRENREE